MAMDSEKAPTPLQLNRPSEVEKRMLFKKISEMENLPTPSDNVMKAMLLLRNKDVHVDQLVAAIEKDQSLVAQILKMVNSSYYNLRTSVNTVERAVSMLGLGNVRQIVYSALIMEFFSADEQVEWNHAYSSAMLMTSIVKDNDLQGSSSLPLAMILHDIGKVVLRRFCPQKYKLVHMQAAKGGIPLFECEMDAIGVTHAEAGAILLEKWGTSEEIATPVLQHHMVDVPEAYVLETALVQYVNWVDCSVRSIPCRRPTTAIMDAAQIEDIDDSYWLDYQRNLIERLEGLGSSMENQGGASLELEVPGSMEKTKKIDKPVSRGSFSPKEKDIIDKRYRQD